MVVLPAPVDPTKASFCPGLDAGLEIDLRFQVQAACQFVDIRHGSLRGLRGEDVYKRQAITMWGRALRAMWRKRGGPM